MQQSVHSNDIILRPIKESDADVNFIRTMFSFTEVSDAIQLADEDAFNLAAFLSSWARAHRKGHAMFYIIETGEGSPVGFILVEPFKNDDGEIVWNTAFAIHPQHRNKGYATQALRSLARILFDQDRYPFMTMSMIIFRDNEEAMAVARSCGFGPGEKGIDLSRLRLGTYTTWNRRLHPEPAHDRFCLCARKACDRGDCLTAIYYFKEALKDLRMKLRMEYHAVHARKAAAEGTVLQKSADDVPFMSPAQTAALFPELAKTYGEICWDLADCYRHRRRYAKAAHFENKALEWGFSCRRDDDACLDNGTRVPEDICRKDISDILEGMDLKPGETPPLKTVFRKEMESDFQQFTKEEGLTVSSEMIPAEILFIALCHLREYLEECYEERENWYFNGAKKDEDGIVQMASHIYNEAVAAMKELYPDLLDQHTETETNMWYEKKKQDLIDMYLHDEGGEDGYHKVMHFLNTYHWMLGERLIIRPISEILLLGSRKDVVNCQEILRDYLELPGAPSNSGY